MPVQSAVPHDIRIMSRDTDVDLVRRSSLMEIVNMVEVLRFSETGFFLVS